MKKRVYQLRAAALIALLFWLASVWVPKAVRAAPRQLARGVSDLRVDGALVNVMLSPGQTYVHHMRISSSSQADISVEASGFGERLDGGFIPLPANQDASPYSARKFITNIDHPSFSLAPGGSAPVAVTIKIPANISSEIYYALIYVHSLAGNTSESIDVNTSVAVPVVITPVGAKLKPAGRITELKVGVLKAGQPVVMLTNVRNIGNCHFKMQGEVTLNDPSGSVLADLQIPLTATPLIPTFSRLFELTYTPANVADGLAPGKYTLEAKVSLEDGTLIDDEKHSFVVPNPNSPHHTPTAEDTVTPTTIIYTVPYSTAIPAASVSPTFTTTPSIQTTPTSTSAIGQLAATLVSGPVATLVNNLGTGASSIENQSSLLSAWEIALISSSLILLFLLLWLALKRKRQESQPRSQGN